MLSRVEAFIGFFSRIFLEDEKVASPLLDSRPSAEFTLSLVERARDRPFGCAQDRLARE